MIRKLLQNMFSDTSILNVKFSGFMIEDIVFWYSISNLKDLHRFIWDLACLRACLQLKFHPIQFIPGQTEMTQVQNNVRKTLRKCRSCPEYHPGASENMHVQLIWCQFTWGWEFHPSQDRQGDFTPGRIFFSVF